MFIADFHIHSKYSRATSRDCVPEILEMWARRKGINVIGTGDFTHPAWREELKEKLIPSGEGLYVLKNNFRQEDPVAGADFQPQFIVSSEISSIYKKNGRVRKVHNLILLPGLDYAESISRRLEAIGNLHSDGRPILGLDSRDLLEIVLEQCPEAIFIPAHIWTPHFSLYGAYSGFDHIQECFEDLTPYIYALETGLSSDPPMNWRLSALDQFTLISNSDAHSPANLAREANLFAAEPSYPGILQALKNRHSQEFYGTLEFFPEEGKYHYDGHRACKVCWKPADTIAAAGLCPVCGGKITVGVLHRLEALADRKEGYIPPAAKHFESLVPLHEVIASSMGLSAASVKVKGKYQDLIRNLGPELFILREATLQDIELAAGPYIAEGVRRLRCGKIDIQPGFDGEYGKIKVMDKSEITLLSGQLCFLSSSTTENQPSALKEKKAAQALPPAPTSPDACLPEGGEAAIKTDSPDRPYGLNPEQWEAVSSPHPAIAVMAGPGTGKTKTLVGRIAHLVENCGVDPSRITAVTFTNQAAKEMRLRLEIHFGDKRTARAMTIGTFHSLCLQILSKGKDGKNIVLIDEQNALSMVGDILKDLQLKISPREAMKQISLLKNDASATGDKKKSDVPAEVHELYRSQLQRYGVLDYDDLLLEVLKLFEGSPEERKNRRLEKPFSYLLVDEFQDINEVQYRLLKAWGRKSENIFIIGDPDQSIYGFRGSDFRYFEKFKEDFPGLCQVRLVQNYRSTPEIIHCATSVISREPFLGPERCLEAKRAKGAPVRLIEAQNEFSEALFVAKEINRMVGGIDMLDTLKGSAANKKRPVPEHPRAFSDIAILYRTNRQARILEQCLLQEGIQYVVAGRDEFLGEQPVREAIAFFSFLLNPGDMLSLRLFLQAESTYTADLRQKVLEEYAALEKNVSSLVGILERIAPPPNIPDKHGNLIERLRKYEPMVHKEKPGKLMAAWINDNALSDLKSMELLLQTAVLYDKMPSFMQNLVLGQESDVVRNGGKAYSSDAVSLMTLHGAKGLEFPVVFLCGVNDGLIPLKNSKQDLDPGEERRLFYVGLTRARDELLLLTSRTPSPFIDDLPEENLVTEKAGTPKQGPQFKQVSLFNL